MKDFNVVIETGNLTRDPELRFSGSGTAVTKFSLAVNHSRKVGNEWKDDANFFDVVTFGQLAENIAESVVKGDRVVVAGRLQWESWEDRNGGGKRSKVSIVADVVAASLERAVVTVNRNERRTAADTAPADPLTDAYNYDSEPF